MSEPSKAVFLSYASQDAEAARRICEALRASGVEVWFDQSELRGGDVWDQKIRQQIHDCALFVPIISTHTDERTEGYFRLEWKLAVDRSHLMADDATFLFPIVIDDTPDASARVPEKFRAVQWTRLPAGAAPPAFSQRVSALLAGTARAAREPAGAAHGAVPPRRGPGLWMAVAAVTALLTGTVGVLSWRAMTRAPGGAPATSKVGAPAASRAPAHSIAVLPFADMSASKDQEYFSDGLAEELLNLLSRVPGLQVAARTSAFSFKGHAADVPTIGRQLMVANVLEGSVRKVGSHLRVTAQLVRTDNGYEVWSEIYDRELGDVFHLQDEIATAVVKALKVTLLGKAAPRSTSTQDPDAYLLFLKGRARMANQRLADIKAAAADFAHVLKLDPSYGPAYVELAAAQLQLAEFEVNTDRQAAFPAAFEESKLLIERALALDPTDAQAYIVRGYLRSFSDPKGAEQDYRRGIKLNPNSARGYVALATLLDADPRRSDEVLPLLERAHQLDPLEQQYDVLRALFLFYRRSDTRSAGALLTSVIAHHPLYLPALVRLAEVRQTEGRFADAVLYSEQALKLDPSYAVNRWVLIMSYINIGDRGAALQVAEETPHPLPLQRLLPLLRAGDWQRGAELAYAALADDTMMPITESWVTLALRMQARQSHDFRRARDALERMCGVTWSAGGIPILPPQLGGASASVALGDLLIASGERERGERLLRASLADMNHVAHDLKRGDFPYAGDQAIATGLLGDPKATIAALRRAMISNPGVLWWTVGIDPAFDSVRGKAGYQAIIQEIKTRTALERQTLDRLRASGHVPDRRTATNSKSAVK